MKFNRSAAVLATLSVACFLGATAPVRAQVTPVASGHGMYVGVNQQTRLFAFAVLELPGGAVVGGGIGIEPASRGHVRFDITSYMLVGDMVLMAGSITGAINAPPQYVVGSTCFFAAKDDGSAPDSITGISVVPPALGNLTIQQIVALIGLPPPVAFSPLLGGDIRIY